MAPLNWGLGHATRCIPIIEELLNIGFNPIIASDGDALVLLQKEFPKLMAVELPSYQIRYPKNGKYLKWNLLFQIPRILKVIRLEYALVQELVNTESLIGIISDNRIGIRSSKIPSVYLSHQINVLSGIGTYFTSKIHQSNINKFDECWIPDHIKDTRLSGKLGEKSSVSKSKYVGILSRFKSMETTPKYDLLVLLSGMEPLRTQLENRLISELKNYEGKVLFVKGQIMNEQESYVIGNIKFYNYLLTPELEIALNESKIVLARSGYSTIMDVAKIGNKAFFIPTKGQDEQEYLAEYLDSKRIAPYSVEKEFKIGLLDKVNEYQGFSEIIPSQLPDNLFDLFEGK